MNKSWADSSPQSRLRAFNHFHPSVPLDYDPEPDYARVRLEKSLQDKRRKERTGTEWEKYTPSWRLKLHKKGDSRVPADYDPTEDVKARRESNNEDRQKWRNLLPSARLELYIANDPRVPEDYQPELDEMCVTTKAAVGRPRARSKKDYLAEAIEFRREKAAEAKRALLLEEVSELSLNQVTELISALSETADDENSLWVLSELRKFTFRATSKL